MSGVTFVISDDGRLIAKDNKLRKKLIDVVVPEGVVRICAGVMRNFSCRKLIMPSTLKVIEEEAFQSARIDEIDFGSCKLERIEDRAFYGCATRAELPDTVEYIGSDCGLSLMKEAKMKFPKSLKYIGSRSLYLMYVREVELQESMVALDSNLLGWLEYGVGLRSWVAIRVFRDDKELYRFVFDDPWYDCTYIGSHGIIYDSYDRLYQYASSANSKAHMAAYRVFWPVDLPSKMEKKYRTYVRNHFWELFKGKEEDIETIRIFIEAGLIKVFHLNQLLENAAKKGNAELAAYLLEEIGKESGAKPKSLEL
jgi:hypothetical protein